MVSGSSIPEARALDASLSRPGAARAGSGIDTGLFTRSVLDYAAHRPGQVISVLQFGCVTADGDLDLAGPDTRRYQFAVTRLDEDNAVTRTAVARQPGLDQAILADLRAVPLTPRSVDVVHCCRLLDRISHTEILLSRLVDALRPGGLLLVRTADRQTAAGFLDRTMPRPLRMLVWRRLRAGQPGPYPAVYESLTSARGSTTQHFGFLSPRSPQHFIFAGTGHDGLEGTGQGHGRPRRLGIRGPTFRAAVRLRSP